MNIKIYFICYLLMYLFCTIACAADHRISEESNKFSSNLITFYTDHSQLSSNSLVDDVFGFIIKSMDDTLTNFDRSSTNIGRLDHIILNGLGVLNPSETSVLIQKVRSYTESEIERIKILEKDANDMNALKYYLLDAAESEQCRLEVYMNWKEMIYKKIDELTELKAQINLSRGIRPYLIDYGLQNDRRMKSLLAVDDIQIHIEDTEAWLDIYRNQELEVGYIINETEKSMLSHLEIAHSLY